MRSRSGFTLIELLIVISIIGVLSVIGMVAYSTFLKNARDAKRQSDLKFIQSALEEYHADQHYYPYSPPQTALPVGSFKSPDGSKIYMSTFPSDPSYAYTSWGTDCSVNTPQNCDNYCLFANMENLSNAKIEDLSCNLRGSGQNYAIVKP